MTVNNLCDLVGKVSKCAGNGGKRDYVPHEGRYLREGVYLGWNKVVSDTLTWNQMLGSVFYISLSMHLKKFTTNSSMIALRL